MIFVLLQLAPPSAEVKDTMRKLTPAKPLIGTITDAMRIVGGRLPCSPGQSAVGGGTHLDQIAQRIVVEFGIAVAVERACGRIIADAPVFVVKMTICIHHDGAAPAQSAISRAADKHINRPCRGHYAKPGDDPHIVLGVKSNRGITDTAINSRWR